MPIPPVGALAVAVALAAGPVIAPPVRFPVAPTAFAVCERHVSTATRADGLSRADADVLVDGLRLLLTDATLSSHSDAGAARLVRDLRSEGITPARSAIGWQQAAFDLADDLVRRAAAGDVDAGDAGVVLARNGFSPTPADLLDDDFLDDDFLDDDFLDEDSAGAGSAREHSGSWAGRDVTADAGSRSDSDSEAHRQSESDPDSSTGSDSGSEAKAVSGSEAAEDLPLLTQPAGIDPVDRRGTLATAIRSRTDSDTSATCDTGDRRTSTDALVSRLRDTDDADATALADQLAPGSAVGNNVNHDTRTSGSKTGRDAGSTRSTTAGARAGTATQGDWRQQTRDLVTRLRDADDDPDARDLAARLASVESDSDTAGADSGDRASRGAGSHSSDSRGADSSDADRENTTDESTTSDDADAEVSDHDTHDDPGHDSTADHGGQSGDDNQDAVRETVPPADAEPTAGAEPPADARPAGGGGEWDRLAECESSGRWDIDTGNGYHGGLQFDVSTWKAYGGEQYAPSAEKASREQQIAVAEKLRADRGGYSAWPACSKKLGL